MKTLLRLVGLAVLMFLAWFTSNKLIKMAQIRGFIAGPPPLMKTITSKVSLEGDHGDVYWIAWDHGPIAVPGRHRVNLPKETWDRFRRGDQIAVYQFPGDRWSYTREDIWSSNENFVFDGVFLTAWLGGIGTLVFLLGRDVLRSRKIPPRLPSA